MKNFFINDGGSLTMLLAIGILAFDLLQKQKMKKAPKWKKFLIIASALIAAFAMVYEAYIRMVNA